MNKEWKPLFQLELMDVINSFHIKELHVGSSDSLIYEMMGEPELPATRLSKKSKIFSYLYGNINILSENHTVIAINIDFHSNRKQMVILGEVGSWNIEDWLELSKRKNWNFSKVGDVVQVQGNRVVIGLSQEGKVGMLSIR